MKRLIQHIPVLQYIRTLNSLEQKKLLLNAPKQLLITLSEIALNLIQRNISLTGTQISKLKKFEKEIVQLSAKKHSLNKRKKILRKGTFFKSLLDSTVPSLMVSLARSKTKNVQQ